MSVGGEWCLALHHLVVWCVGVVLTRTACPAPRRVFQSVRLWDSSPILQISRSSTSEHSGLADITTYHEIQVCNIGDTAVWKPAGIIYYICTLHAISPNITHRQCLQSAYESEERKVNELQVVGGQEVGLGSKVNSLHSRFKCNPPNGDRNVLPRYSDFQCQASDWAREE